MLEKKCTCLVCFDWTQDLLLNLTLWFCMKYYAREIIMNSVCIINATTVFRSLRQHVVHKSNMVKLA